MCQYQQNVNLSLALKILLIACSGYLTDAQQRGLTGEYKIQLPIRSPIYTYNAPVNNANANTNNANKDIVNNSGLRSLIQFDRMDPEEEDPSNSESLPQNDPTSPDQGLDAGIIVKLKIKLKQRLSSRRQGVEKMIKTKFNELEKDLALSEASFLDQVVQLNQTLLELERLILLPPQNSEPNNEVENRIRKDMPATARKDNALLHLFSVVNSFDFSEAGFGSIPTLIQTLFEFNNFVSFNDELESQAQDRIDDESEDNSTITSSECGGPAITIKEGTFTFNPSPTWNIASQSRGTCIWRLAPAGVQSITVRVLNDGFLRQFKNSSLTFVPQTINTSSSLRYGVNFDRKTIKESCKSEWNCHSWDGGPEDTRFRTHRVINILKNGGGAKQMNHRDPSSHTFQERNVYIMLKFDGEYGHPPPPFTVSFKGRDCSIFCPNEDKEASKEKTEAEDESFLFSVLLALSLYLESAWKAFQFLTG